MIGLFVKLFIKDYQSVAKPQVRQAYGILCGAVGICFNVILFAGKFFAGTISGSIAITADAVNNLSDAGSSLITLLGFKVAGQKPDSSHPFGHGRVEYLSGLMVSAAIVIMAVELISSSVKKILHPEEIVFSPVILVILLVSIAVKGYMAFYNRRIAIKIDSTAMKATGKDSLSDAMSTFVVLLATLVSHFFAVNIDGYCGVLVGLFILYTGISAAKDTISPLLGQSPDPEFVKKIEDIVMSFDGIIGVHDLVVHDYGPGRVMISLHAEVSAEGNILVLHDVIDNAERMLREQLLCEAVIHMDPVLTEDEETEELRELVKGYIAEMDAMLTIHDFRIVKGPSHTNIIFDMVVPYRYPLSDAEIKERIGKRIHEANPNCYAVIEIDKQYAK